MTQESGVKAWVTPKTVQEAVDILQHDGTKIIAGGTAIYELAKRGMIPRTHILVDLSALNLDFLLEEQDAIRVGASTGVRRLLNNPIFRSPSLLGIQDSLQKMKPIQVRNVATVGGAICASLSFLEVPVSLLGHGASVRIAGPSGERVVDLENFWLDYLLPDLRKGEFVTEIDIPRAKGLVGSSYVRLGRTASDFALVNVCSLIELDSRGNCVSSHIALGGMVSTPIRLHSAEQELRGMNPQEQDLSPVLEKVDRLNPVPAIQGSPWYKKEIGKKLLRDSIMLASKRALVHQADSTPS